MRRLSRLRDHAEMLVPPLPWDRPRWRNRGGPTVVLLHGLWRGWRAMEPMARALRAEGFSTLNLPYPSARQPIPDLVDHLHLEIEKIAGGGAVHFVTHSLGGILARALISDAPSWKIGRIVMLAPPNGGSEIVDASRHTFFLHRVLGPAGKALGTDGFPRELPELPAHCEACAIMGKRASIPFFKRMLESENDGIVSVSTGQIPGLRGFSVIDADHTFIQVHPEAIRLSVEFLKTGSWSC